MGEAALDKFGRILIRKIRDEAISDWKMMIDGRMKGELAEKVRQVLDSSQPDCRSSIVHLVPGIVDTVLHHVLWTIEQETDLDVGMKTDAGIANIRDISDGLPGELYSDDGWIARFSEEDRF